MGIKVKLRVELTDATMVPLTEIALPDKHRPFCDYGLEIQDDPGYATPVHAVAQYLNRFLDIKTKDISKILGTQNNNINKIAGIYPNGSINECNEYFWMYMINDAYPLPSGSKYGYNMTTCPLEDGDIITIYAVRYMYTNYYGFFNKLHFNVKLGEMINLTLLGRRVTGGDSFPIAGAALTTISKKTQNKQDIITDSDGEVIVSFKKTGSYLISAIREDISRAYVNIHVIV